jgi:hypothetical protein
LPATVLGDITATVTGSDGVTHASATASLTDSPPVISNFTATSNGRNIWTFGGTVSAQYAPGLVVTFSGGPAAINGQTAVVQANGTFSLTVQISSSTSGSANISAQVVSDWWGEASNVSFANITWTGSGGHGKQP